MSSLDYQNGVFSAVATFGHDATALELPSNQINFGYDAVEPSKHRKNRAHTIKAEELILTGQRRDRLSSTTQDLIRNFELAGWMVRKHLDYVTECEFHASTGNQGFDDEVEEFIREHSEPLSCDSRRKMSLDELFRVAEASKIGSGDILGVRLDDLSLQLIESDLLRDPPQGKGLDDSWRLGVKLNQYEQPQAYSVYKRGRRGAGYDFVRTIGTGNAYLYGDIGAVSQTRGVSILSSSVNRICDLYESFGYALSKAKMAQLMGIIVTAQGDGLPVEADGEGYKWTTTDAPQMFNMAPGEDMKIIESATPPHEFQAFASAMIHVCLLCLDLPFSFYDETQTTFFGSNAARLHYDRSCGPKRRKHLRFRHWYTHWVLARAILTGKLKPPRSAKVGKTNFKWVPKGTPWWNPAQEITADIKAIAAGLDTPQRICLERGRGSYDDNILQIAEAAALAEKHGVRVSWQQVTDPKVAPNFTRDAEAVK